MALTSGPNPPGIVNVLVHTSMGSRYHYWVPKEIGLPVMNKVLENPLPVAHGIIPQTHHTDTEPLGAFVITSEPTMVGSVLPARTVGLMKMEGGGRIVDKILTVCSLDSEFQDIEDIGDVPKRTIKQIEKAIKEDWTTKITWLDAARAKRSIERAMEMYKREFG